MGSGFGSAFTLELATAAVLDAAGLAAALTVFVFFTKTPFDF
jgi:hypothetical protein